MTSKESILEHVCGYYGISETEVKGKKRQRHIVKARQVYFYLSRKYSRASLMAMAELLNRDHATAIHGIRKVEDELSVYPEFYAEMSDLKTRLTNYALPVVRDIDLLKISENYTRKLKELHQFSII